MLDHHPQLAVANDIRFIPQIVEELKLGANPPVTSELLDCVRDNRHFPRLGLPEGALQKAAEQSRTFAELVGALYSEFAAARGKALAGEKSADYVRRLPLLQALFDEGPDPEAAIIGYHYVIEHASKDRDFPFLIPSYFRLSDLLEHVGRPADALPIVERFLERYDGTSPVAATESHLAIMKARQTRLTMMLKVHNYT